jgi:polyhydroxybutyrate depolymerase
MSRETARRNDWLRVPFLQLVNLAACTLTLACGVLAPDTALACGPASDCRVGDRTYRITMPAGHDGRASVGAVFYAHGHRGTAAGAMANPALRKAADEAGVALVALKSSGPGWTLPGSPSSFRETVTDEVAYVRKVVEDVTGRFAVDPGRLMLTGFSAGGMLTWNVACSDGGLFAAYLPMSGTFWRPVPASCPSPPVSLTHLHGDADKVVPLTGRVIGPARQGDVAEVLRLYGETGSFGETEPFLLDDLHCYRRTNGRGNRLEFCLFRGGHNFRPAFIARAWQRFRDAGIIP